MAAVDPKASLQGVMRGLFDRPIQLTAAPKFEPAAAKAAVIAVYTGPEGNTIGLMVCSVQAAAYLGAALSLLPKPVAEDAIKRSALDDALLENFREVANICSSMFAEQAGCRAHLGDVLNKITVTPPELKALMATTNRVDVTIDVPNYGQGVISIRLPKAH